MSCAICERDVPIENEDTGLCATCNKDQRNADNLYPQVRKMFLALQVKYDKECPFDQTPITMDSDIHHKRGRAGYASEAKRLAGIPLVIDVQYFLACNRPGHQWIEANPLLAKLRGWSQERYQKEDELPD